MPSRVLTAARKPVSALACFSLAFALVRCGSEAGSDSPFTPLPDGGESTLDGAPSATPDSGSSVNTGDGGGEVDALADVVTPIDVGTTIGDPPPKDWELTSPATNREIEGYPSRPSVAPGDRLSIFVSTAAAKYTIEVFRLGWYDGIGGKQFVAPTERTGTLQKTPQPDADGLVECDWTDPYEITVPPEWVSGIYLAKLTTGGSDKKQAYVPFVVRDDKRAAKYLVQSSITTMQAYNNWGGKSLYDFNSTGGRATRVSFLRPFALGANPASAIGVGAGEILTNLQPAGETAPLGWEIAMVRFLEKNGYDASYVTGIDVHRDPGLVARHPVFVSMGHDEFWSARMRDHVEYARDHGTTSLAFFSGNVSFWQMRMQPSKTGVPDSTMYCAKDAKLDPLAATTDAWLTTVRFDDPLLTRGEDGLAGVAYAGDRVNGDLTVAVGSAWPFQATGLATGDSLPGLLGYEVDAVREPALPGVRVIGRSAWTNPDGPGVSHMTIRALPSGAETFAAGSIQFPWGLDDFRPAGIKMPPISSPLAQTLAKNVLERFGTPRSARNRSPIFLDEPFATLDAERWSARVLSEGPLDPGVTARSEGGRLTITPLASAAGAHHGGVTSARTFPMMCGMAQVELAQATSGGANTTFAVAVDGSHWYRMRVERTSLVLGASDGTPSTTSVAYSAAQHRYLRIRHDCVADRMLLEASPDRTTWATLRIVPRTVDLRAAYVELAAGSDGAVGSPGQALFDDVHVESMGVMDLFDAQRDPEVWTPDALHEGGYDPDLPVFVQGGRLHLRPRGGLTDQHHLGFATSREIDWTGGVAGVSFAQGPNPDTEASVSLAILPDVAGWARITLTAGRLYFQSELARSRSGSFIRFDANQHRRARIRHVVASNELVWETSPDGASWTERRRVACPFPVTKMRAEIEGGTYQPESNPGEALVDSVVFGR